MEEKSKEKKKKGPVLVFVAPSVASHTGRCHLTNGQLETEQQFRAITTRGKNRFRDLLSDPVDWRSLKQQDGWRR